MRGGRPFFAALLLAASACLSACGGLCQKDLEGEAPPAVGASGSSWLNTDPLTLSSLRGKVVYLEFGFHG